MDIIQAIKANETNRVKIKGHLDFEIYAIKEMKTASFTDAHILADWEIVREPEVVEFEADWFCHLEVARTFVYPNIDPKYEHKLTGRRWKVRCEEVLGEK